MQTKHMKMFAFTLMLLAFVSVGLVSCIRPGTGGTGGSEANSGTTNGGGGATSGSSGSNAVHMGSTTFIQTTVTIKKGSKVTLIDDVASQHIITNGTWGPDGTPHPKKEPDAPAVNVTFNGNDTQDIGPFNTAGSFQLYCTIHQAMNLTVTVQ